MLFKNQSFMRLYRNYKSMAHWKNAGRGWGWDVCESRGRSTGGEETKRLLRGTDLSWKKVGIRFWREEFELSAGSSWCCPAVFLNCWFCLGNFQQNRDAWIQDCNYSTLYICMNRIWYHLWEDASLGPDTLAIRHNFMWMKKKVSFLWAILVYSKSSGWTSDSTGIQAQTPLGILVQWAPYTTVCSSPLRSPFKPDRDVSYRWIWETVLLKKSYSNDGEGNESKKLWNQHQAKETTVLHSFSIYSFGSYLLST